MTDHQAQTIELVITPAPSEQQGLIISPTQAPLIYSDCKTTIPQGYTLNVVGMCIIFPGASSQRTGCRHRHGCIYMNSAGACTRVNIHIGALQLSVFQIHSLLNITPLGSDIILMSNINKIIDIRYANNFVCLNNSKHILIRQCSAGPTQWSSFHRTTTMS